MRLFTALALPEPVRNGVISAFSAAHSLAPRVKWVAPDNLHLTLHFLGEVPEEQVSRLEPVFSDPALQRPPIRTVLGPAGFFPPTGVPRVLWVGIRQGVEEMRAFWTLLGERLEPLRVPGGPLQGWEPDRRGFSPHVTVARPGAAALEPRWAGEAEVASEPFFITECILFQSLLGGGGPRYVPLQRLALRGGAA